MCIRDRRQTKEQLKLERQKEERIQEREEAEERQKALMLETEDIKELIQEQKHTRLINKLLKYRKYKNQ